MQPSGKDREKIGGPRTTAAIVLVLVSLVSPFAGAREVPEILGLALSLRGAPYRSGGVSPSGFDCSGFVSFLYKPDIPALPRSSRRMAGVGAPVDQGAWIPGDLLFYATGPDPAVINHVGIWLGDGRLVHAVSDGPETGVIVTPAEARYWRRRYVSSRRVLPEPSVNVQPPKAEATIDAPVNPTDEVPEPAPPAADTVTPTDPADSPWNDFEGYLRGDYESWRAADEEAFQEFLRQGG